MNTVVSFTTGGIHTKNSKHKLGLAVDVVPLLNMEKLLKSKTIADILGTSLAEWIQINKEEPPVDRKKFKTKAAWKKAVKVQNDRSLQNKIRRNNLRARLAYPILQLLRQDVIAAGLKIIDERCKPTGKATGWTGAHLHIEISDGTPSTPDPTWKCDATTPIIFSNKIQTQPNSQLTPTENTKIPVNITINSTTCEPSGYFTYTNATGIASGPVGSRIEANPSPECTSWSPFCERQENQPEETNFTITHGNGEIQIQNRGIECQGDEGSDCYKYISYTICQ